MKKLFSIFLSLLMLSSMVFCVDLSAYATVSGDYTYSVLADGTAEINKYNGNATELDIPSEIDGYQVTSISGGAFEDCTTLTSITIPYSVKSIGIEAFYNCSRLTSIVVKENNKNYSSLDGVLFNKDKTLLIKYPMGNENTSYTIPDSVTSIGNEAFEYCNSLTSITIPDGVTSIGIEAFEYCNNLTSITIPDSVTSVGNSAFSWCSRLTSITMPDSVKSIGYDVIYDTAYYNNENNWVNDVLYINNCLIKIKNTISGSYSINANTKIIADGAFYGCDSLTSITIPEGVTVIGDYTFNSCTSLTSIAIPEGVTVIGDYTFNSCTSLTSITIPEGVTSINEGAFGGCSSLTSITIPDSVTSIGDYAFSGCNSLEKIVIISNNCNIADSEYTIPEQTVIYGYTGSTAQTYAEKYNRQFVAIDDCEHTFVTETQTTTATENTDGKIEEVEKCSVCDEEKSRNTVSIIPKVSTIELQKTTIGYNWYYTGKQITPYVTVKDSTGTALKQGTDYSLEYEGDRVNIGKYSIEVTFKGNYSGTETLTFEIVNKPVNKWIKSGNRWWYRHADGSYTKNNWEKISGKWYHFDKYGWMQTGWLKDGGKWYYLNSSGAMATGWVKVSNKWYYMNTSGAMQTGWLKLGGKWYYLNSSGAMLTGRQKIGNKYYTFNSSGVWVK